MTCQSCSLPAPVLTPIRFMGEPMTVCDSCLEGAITADNREAPSDWRGGLYLVVAGPRSPRTHAAYELTSATFCGRLLWSRPWLPADGRPTCPECVRKIAYSLWPYPFHRESKEPR